MRVAGPVVVNHDRGPEVDAQPLLGGGDAPGAGVAVECEAVRERDHAAGFDDVAGEADGGPAGDGEQAGVHGRHARGEKVVAEGRHGRVPGEGHVGLVGGAEGGRAGPEDEADGVHVAEQGGGDAGGVALPHEPEGGFVDDGQAGVDFGEVEMQHVFFVFAEDLLQDLSLGAAGVDGGLEAFAWSTAGWC